jgi:hypothetical protein
MNGTDAGEAPMVYELTIAGPIGAVFRSAVLPHDVARSGVCTILRAGTAPGRDLVDLVLHFHEQGLSVEGVLPLED